MRQSSATSAPGSLGVPVFPVEQTSPSKRMSSLPAAANRLESASWSEASMCTVKTPLIRRNGSVFNLRSGQTSTSGGSIDTLLNAKAVMPKRYPPHSVVTMVTPLAQRRSAALNRSRSIAMGPRSRRSLSSSQDRFDQAGPPLRERAAEGVAQRVGGFGAHAGHAHAARSAVQSRAGSDSSVRTRAIRPGSRTPARASSS